MEKKRKKRTPTSVETISLLNLKVGQSFYTEKQDKDVTAVASYYNKKVKTERLFVMNPQSGLTNRVVKVTILEDA
jgi:hypothetical protein